MPKCPPTGGVRLQEVSFSGGSTVLFLIASFDDVKKHCVQLWVQIGPLDLNLACLFHLM